MAIDASCPIFFSKEENTLHAFLDCEVALVM